MKRYPIATIGCAASLVIAGHAGLASAADIAYINGLRASIAAAEQTLAQTPDIARYCGALRDQLHFYHRGRAGRRLPPIVSLSDWDAYVDQLAARGQISVARASDEKQNARRRRNEDVNACGLDGLRAALATALRPPEPGSATAGFVWNDPESYKVIGVAPGRGTLTGSQRGWIFNATGTASWNGALQVQIQCAGQLDPGVHAGSNSRGVMECHATWTENGKQRRRDCRGNGLSHVSWSLGDWWFGMWPGQCVGTEIGLDAKSTAVNFGLVGISSRLGDQ